MTDQLDRAESKAPSERAEPMEKADSTEPTDPIESAEPTEKMERTEPFDPIDSTDPSDHSDQSEPEDFVPIIGPSSSVAHLATNFFAKPGCAHGAQARPRSASGYLRVPQGNGAAGSLAPI
jgi:hypothetical protein